MVSVQVPGFRPSVDGFHFGNSWPSQPNFSVGPIHVGNAAKGLCGGMAYAVRDFFEASRPIPADTTHPGPSTDLYHFIVRRLFQSFDIPIGVLKYVVWQSRRTRTQYRKTIVGEWPKIQKLLDKGTLVPLGVIRVSSLNPLKLGRNHQVLAFGYECPDDSGNSEDGLVVLHLYDPNHHDQDDVTVRFDGKKTDGSIVYSAGGASSAEETTFGLFVTRYKFRRPPG